MVSHSPPASETGMRLITTFVELGVVAGKSRKRAGNPQAVALRRTAWSGMALARHGKCESDTAALCKSMGKTHSEPIAARHGRGMGMACYM